MTADYMVCNCKQVSCFKIMDVLEHCTKLDDVLKAFDEVQAVTHCSTGCGGCYNKFLDVISDVMMGQK